MGVRRIVDENTNPNDPPIFEFDISPNKRISNDTDILDPNNYKYTDILLDKNALDDLNAGGLYLCTSDDVFIEMAVLGSPKKKTSAITASSIGTVKSWTSDTITVQIYSEELAQMWDLDNTEYFAEMASYGETKEFYINMKQIMLDHYTLLGFYLVDSKYNVVYNPPYPNYSSVVTAPSRNPEDSNMESKEKEFIGSDNDISTDDKYPIVKGELLETVKIRYHKELYPELKEIQWTNNGDFIDLRAAEDLDLKEGEFKFLSLGISVKLPDGYWAQVVPRSSTFKNYGILMTNSFGVIDNSYSGDNDIWKMPIYATRDTHISLNDRVAQFTIHKKQNFKIETVELLEGEDRGGLGSSGVK